MSSSTAHEQKLIDLTDSLKKKAENLLINEFPKRILDVDAMQMECFTIECRSKLSLQSQGSLPKQDSSLSEDEVTPSYRTNPVLEELFTKVKPIFKCLQEDMQSLELWILLNIPQIEDGNNFGVSIQEEVLTEIGKIQVDAQDWLNSAYFHHYSRGKVISRIVKYPQIEDYRQDLSKGDEWTFDKTHDALKKTRKHYLNLYAKMTKNLEKLRNPRSNNTSAMY